MVPLVVQSPADQKHTKTPMTDALTDLPPRRHWWKIPARLLFFVLLATAIGWTLNRIGKTLERSPQPAGFSRGVVQGALMPMALPNLLVGKDVIIYAQKNTGVTYKLGYTVGVNTCGALFFGLFFWRISRWRRLANAGRLSER